jgi:cytochrome c
MKTDKEIAEKARERAKKQNEAAKNNWDCISCRLPKGTKDRIQALGYTVNGFLNIIVLAELEKLEAEAPQTAQPETAKEEQPKADAPEDVAALNNWLHQVQEENEQKRLQEVARRQSNVEAENGYD